MADNDYTKLAEDIQQAINVAETAYYNANDDDIQAEIQDALDALGDAKTKCEARA